MSTAFPGPVPEREPRCSEVQAALQLLGRSHCGAVLQAVLDGCGRYSEIKLRCQPISDALLAARLRELCLAGLLIRSTVDRTVIYTATQVGLDTRPVLSSLTRLVRQHPQAFLPLSHTRK